MAGEAITHYKHATACGEVIRSVRKQRGLSLKNLEKRSGLPFQYLSKIERGEINTPLETLAIIAEALDVPMAQLFPPETSITPEQISALVGTLSPSIVAALYVFLLTCKQEMVKH
jgi:transcriptional regulator with XRE-family HTH domain